MSDHTMQKCCFTGFEWEGTPAGREETLGNNPVYITGSNPNHAVLYIHDGLGWKWRNARLLADHYAREANVTVYLPDFFGGEELPQNLILAGRWGEIDMKGFSARNNRGTREPEIVNCAKLLREKSSFLGAVGFCFGGWASYRLGAKEFVDEASGRPLVDCIVVGHPSLLIERDVDELAVPVQMLVPEMDSLFTDDLKAYTFKKLTENKTVFDWQYFPGLAHGCMTKGDENVPGEREAMLRGKNAAVEWLKLHKPKS